MNSACIGEIFVKARFTNMQQNPTLQDDCENLKAERVFAKLNLVDRLQNTRRYKASDTTL